MQNATATQPQWTYVDEGDVTVVTFRTTKIIEDDQIKQIRAELLQFADTWSGTKLLLDFTRVDFLSSAFMGALIALGKRLARKNKHLRFCSMIRPIYEVFAITKLHHVFEIDPDRTTSMTQFAGPIPDLSHWLHMQQ